MTKKCRTSSRFRCSSIESGLGRVEGFSNCAVKTAGSRDCETMLTLLSIGEGSGSAFAECLIWEATPIIDGAAARAAGCFLPNISGWSSTRRWASACAMVGSTGYGSSSRRPLGNGARGAAIRTKQSGRRLQRNERLPQGAGRRPDRLRERLRRSGDDWGGMQQRQARHAW